MVGRNYVVVMQLSCCNATLKYTDIRRKYMITVHWERPLYASSAV